MADTRIGAGLSTAGETVAAFDEAAQAARGQLGQHDVDLCILFASRSHLDEIDEGLATVTAIMDPAHLIGCCAQGVVGGGQEVEHGAGASVWAASLPGSAVESFHLIATLDDGDASVSGMPSPAGTDLMLLMTDPLTFPAEALLDHLAEEHPGLPVIGGIASGAQGPEEPVLFHDGKPVDRGAVGALLRDVDVLPCVSQGAAPIGPEMVVTAADGNIVLELASKPALAKLAEVIADMGERERALAATGLLIGIVIDENKPAYERGDFLIRGLLGADESSGALAIGDQVRVGQTVRFHVRDGESADEDLREALSLQSVALRGRSAAGALLFTCNGRGRHMFPVGDHDAGALEDSFGPLPMSGFFCSGEIGPVGGRNFLHGFTATMALFPR